MLSRKTRILSKNLAGFFEQTVKTRFFTLKSRKNGLDYNRFAVILGSKLGNSVARHRLKRRVCAFLYKWPARGRDYVIMAKPETGKIDYKTLKEAVEDMIPKTRNDI